jgi:hypothetical protein
MVEIEIDMLPAGDDEREALVAEINAWKRQRNDSDARIKWMFTTGRVRNKLGPAYPKLNKES